jgi:putative SOS response-associated peptidase YedK
MCANYTPTRAERLAAQAGVYAPGPHDFKPETYPGYLAPVIRTAEGLSSGEAFERQLDYGMFGLVPAWANLKLARSTYNARTETVDTKPSFRTAWKRRQFCAIPLENFFEPNYESGKPVRWRIQHADGIPLAVAGLWEWRPNGGPEDRPLISFTMLTINADEHPLMKRFHKPDDEKRMIVLLEPNQIDEWLQAPIESASTFFQPYDADKLMAEAAPKQASMKKIDVEPEPEIEDERDLF